MTTTTDILKKAKKEYPKQDVVGDIQRKAFIRGYQVAIEESNPSSQSFMEELATKLRDLWPAGEKDGKYPWRDSVSNLVKRLEFLWKERNLKDKYTIDDCLIAARRYLAQFENNVKYMQILKYFIFKQNKLVAKDGKVTYTYKSTFSDLLEDDANRAMLNEWDSLFESSNTFEQGELI